MHLIRTKVDPAPSPSGQGTMAHSGDGFAGRLTRLEDAEQIRQLTLEYRPVDPRGGPVAVPAA
jgi:hypothetical protein